MSDLSTLAAIALVVGVASLIQQAAGFGFSLAAAPLLAVLVDAHSAVVLAVLTGFVGIAWQAVDERAACDWAAARRILLGASVGLGVGVALFQTLDAQLLQVAVGVVVLATVVALARGIDLRRATTRLDYGSGMVSGVLTTSVGTAGPPVAFALSARHFPPTAFRATLTSVFVLLDALGIAMFAVVGAVTPAMLAVVALTLPALAAGGAIGRLSRHRLSPAGFRRLTLTMLAAAGLAALLGGLGVTAGP